jgi:hypothetical protein
MNGEIPGKYINKKNRSHFLELKPDGSYFLSQGSVRYSGRYEVSGNEIMISIGDSTSAARIQNDVITDTDGDHWVRAKVTAGGVIDDDPLPDMTWIPPIFRREDFPWEWIDAAIAVVVLVGVLFVGITQKP